MKIVFIGCVKSSELFLNKLIEIEADIVGVVTKSKSDFNSDFSDIGGLCRKNNIDFIFCDNVNDREVKDYIRNKNVDIILCLGWSQILDAELLSIPKYGSVGFHPAELPYNRGRHPLVWALALGLEQTASTLFLMDENADTGNILSQKYVNIDYEDDAYSLYMKIMKEAVIQLEMVITNFETAMNNSIKQKNDIGNSWRKRNSKDGEIDWRMSSRGVYNLVRALTHPYAGAHFIYEKKEYKVWKVREILTNKYNNIEPGKVISFSHKNKFMIKTGDNAVEVLDCDDILLHEKDYLY